MATVGSSSSRTASEVLLNTAGVSSDPATHEAKLATPVSLGSSGGNNNDYDTSGNQIVDCCGGTLGSLIQNSSGTQYLLSNNHVLARSDQASVGETIVQPGLIDDNCTPYGQTGAAITPVGTLTGFLPLKSSLDQCGRGDCRGELGRGEHGGQHSGTGCAAGERNAGRCAAGDFLDGRQGRERSR